MKKAMLALAAATALFCTACERKADTPVTTTNDPVAVPVVVDPVTTPDADAAAVTPVADAPETAPDAVIVTEPVAVPAQ